MSINLEEKIDHTSKYPGYQKRWLTPDDLEIEYSYSKSIQSKMRMVSNSSTIPFSKTGKFIRYDRKLINLWLEEHQVQGASYGK